MDKKTLELINLTNARIDNLYVGLKELSEAMFRSNANMLNLLKDLHDIIKPLGKSE